MNDKMEILETAAKHLCTVAAGHSLECGCDLCAAACAAVPFLPEMSPDYKQQFERRIAVQAVVQAQKERQCQPQ